MLVAKISIQQRENLEFEIRDAAIIDPFAARSSPQALRDRGSAKRARAAAHSSNSGTGGTAMYRTLRKCRLEAL